MKFAEAKGAPLFNGNMCANTSLIQSEPFSFIPETSIETTSIDQVGTGNKTFSLARKGFVRLITPKLLTHVEAYLL